MSKKASLGTYVLVFLKRSTILSFVTECAKEVSIYNFKQPQRHIHDKSFAKDIKTRAETQNLFEVRAM